MPFPGGTYITQIRSAVIWVADELEQFYALLEGYLRVQHNEDGTHAVITADSVEASGDVTSGGDGTFDGTVTADADGTPVSLGPLGPVGEPAVQITSGTSSSWQIYAAAPNHTLYLRDVLDAGHTSHINVVRTALDVYDVRPASSSLSLTLGTDASGQRWAEVNAVIARASSRTDTGVLNLKTRTAPAQLTGSVNDYAINGGGRVILSTNGAYDITGIVAGNDGELLWLFNNNSFALTLVHNSGSSAAGNRFLCPNTASVVMGANSTSVFVLYDATIGAWLVLGT